MRIEIIDLGINNLNSVRTAITSQMDPTDELKVVNTRINSSERSLIFIPGLGNFAAGVNALKASALDSYVKEKSNEGSFIVGICLGMQLLGTSSEESPGSFGLDLIPGNSERFSPALGERIPNIGWSEVRSDAEALAKIIEPTKDYYFVHSYHFKPEKLEVPIATSPFGSGRFVSAVKLENVYGFQFHPEKSSIAGRKLLANLMRVARDEM